MVLEENWPTVMLFLSLQTQWRIDIAPMSGEQAWRGLRYSAVQAALQMMGLRRDAKALFDGVRLMESAALPILNQRRT